MADERKILIRVYRKRDNFFINILANLICLLPADLAARIWVSDLGRKLFFGTEVIRREDEL